MSDLDRARARVIAAAREWAEATRRVERATSASVGAAGTLQERLERAEFALERSVAALDLTERSRPS